MSPAIYFHLRKFQHRCRSRNGDLGRGTSCGLTRRPERQSSSLQVGVLDRELQDVRVELLVLRETSLELAEQLELA
jgi:hypothetical protein